MEQGVILVLVLVAKWDLQRLLINVLYSYGHYGQYGL